MSRDLVATDGDDGENVRICEKEVLSQPRPHRQRWALSQTTLPGPGGVGRADGLEI